MLILAVQSVAFFSLVDVDSVLRKEVDAPCLTPSNPAPVPPGYAVDIHTVGGWRGVFARHGHTGFTLMAGGRPSRLDA